MRIGTEKVPMSPALKAEINKQCKFYGTGRPMLVSLHIADGNKTGIKAYVYKHELI